MFPFLRTFAERLVRRRLGLTLIVALAAALILVNEWSYQASRDRLSQMIRVSTARLAMASLTQSISDAQAAQRGFLLDAGLNQTVSDFDKAVQRVQPYLAELEGTMATLGSADPKADAAALREVVERKLSEMHETLRLARSGQREAALELVRSGIGQEYWDQFDRLTTPHVNSGRLVQEGNRSKMFAMLSATRWGVHLLAALGLLSIYVFVHQLQLTDAERSRHQAQLEAEHRMLDEQVRHRTDELRELATYLQSAQEDERTRIARELHDELGGLFTASKLEVARFSAKIRDDELRPGLKRLTGFLNDGIALKRRIIEDLQPSSLRALGLPSALEMLCMESGERLNVPIRTEIDDGLSVQPPVDLTIYRFVQEALTNIAKYAQATRVQVRVERHGPDMHVEVIDDGIGFDPKAVNVGAHGLAGMRFRVESHGGRMRIESSPGKGSRLSATIPGEEVPPPDTIL